jgi:hypothetical protein
LLESTSALDQGLIWQHVEAAAQFGANLPCTPAQLASYCASRPLQKDAEGNEKTPGDETNVVYGNLDYFLLSQVVAKLCKKSTFEKALDKLVLKPLDINRVRGSRSLLSEQEEDEARYDTVNINPEPVFDKGKPTGTFTDYPPSLWIDFSSRSSDRPIVPNQYGTDNYEIYDGCGGLSGAVTDIARLMAAFSPGANNPVFSETTLDSWFQNTIAATKFLNKEEGDHGVHGFDSGGVFDLTKPVTEPGNFAASKGGWMPSHFSFLVFAAGGLGIVMVANNCGQKDIKTGWFSDLNGDGAYDENSVLGIAYKRDWGTTDLFPQFGMSSFFDTTSLSAEILKIDVSKIIAFSTELQGLNSRVRNTMTKQREKSVRKVSDFADSVNRVSGFAKNVRKVSGFAAKK